MAKKRPPAKTKHRRRPALPDLAAHPVARSPPGQRRTIGLRCYDRGVSASPASGSAPLSLRGRSPRRTATTYTKMSCSSSASAPSIGSPRSTCEAVEQVQTARGRVFLIIDASSAQPQRPGQAVRAGLAPHPPHPRLCRDLRRQRAGAGRCGPGQRRDPALGPSRCRE